MQLDFIFRAFRPKPEAPRTAPGVMVAVPCPAVFVRNRKARRYILRLRPDGVARVTVPWSGTLKYAREFLQRNTPWLEQQLAKRKQQVADPKGWQAGTEVFFRGTLTRLEAAGEYIHLGSERIAKLGDSSIPVDLRPVVERHLRQLAARELPPRVMELAALHQFTVRRVTVRNQRTRWGSCSRRGTISLNWRLVQTPEFVRDYIILHELAHLRHMNHSARYWQEVERLCPGYEAAERWVKAHGRLLH